MRSARVPPPMYIRSLWQHQSLRRPAVQAIVPARQHASHEAVEPLAQGGLESYLWIACQAIESLPPWRHPYCVDPEQGHYLVYVIWADDDHVKVGGTGNHHQRFRQHATRGYDHGLSGWAAFSCPHEAWAVEGLLQRMIHASGYLIQDFDVYADRYARAAAPGFYCSLR